MSLPWLIAAQMIVSPPLGEPVQIQVGDPSVDGSFIRPYRARWKLTLVTVDHQVIPRGFWEEKLEIADQKGRPVLKRTVTATRPDGALVSTVTLLVDAATFAPLLTEERQTSGPWLRFEFDGSTLRGERSSSGANPRPIAIDLRRRVFDYYGGMMDLLPATLPLREGYAAAVPVAIATFGPDADHSKTDRIALHVRRQDTVQAAGRQVTAWLVESNGGFGFYKVWVSKELPYVHRVVFVGPLGGRITYEQLEAGPPTAPAAGG